MSRFEIIFEVGKRFHELPRGLARSGINLRPGAQMSDKARQETLNRAYDNQREMRDIMSDTTREMPYFVAQEFAEIYIFQYEFNTPDDTIQVIAIPSVKARAVARLIACEREETDKERERSDD